jgi:hypothetical protein
MSIIEALKNPKIIVLKFVSINGEKISARQISWSRDGTVEIGYKNGKFEEFKFKHVLKEETTTKIQLENGSIIEMQEYENQEAEKLKLIKEIGR